MSITKAELQRLADLAKLSTETATSISKDLNQAVAWVTQLAAINTEGVAPLISPSEHALELEEDAAGTPMPHEQALLNAPAKDSNYFHAPPSHSL